MENESSPNIIGTLCTIQRLGGASGFAAAWFYILCEDAVGEFWVISGHKDRNVGEWYDAYWIPQTGKNDPRDFIEQHPDQRTDYQRQHHDKKILRPGRTLNADAGGDKAHDLHDAVREFRTDLVSKQRANGAADEDGDGVDDCTEHCAGPLAKEIRSIS